ncbi:MAG: hypothetical protein KJ889_09735 [Gammaproteobacteria bacterium]|nr:hypothetical protein [Gammaproteobacteria bacterium]
MNSPITTYEVSHSWGDPREPEYKNDLPVSYAHYHEGDIALHFKVVGTRLPDSREVRWVLEAPVNTRKVLGKRWADRAIIFDRVVVYLEGLGDGDLDRKPGGKRFANLTVDTSMVPSRLSTVLKEVSNQLSLFLPSRQIFPLVGLGLAIAYAKQHFHFAWPWLPEKSVSFTLLFLGLVSMLMLAREAERNYRIFKNGLWGLSKMVPNFNLRTETFRVTVKTFGYRYVITFALSVLLIRMGLN